MEPTLDDLIAVAVDHQLITPAGFDYALAVDDTETFLHVLNVAAFLHLRSQNPGHSYDQAEVTAIVTAQKEALEARRTAARGTIFLGWSKYSTGPLRYAGTGSTGCAWGDEQGGQQSPGVNDDVPRDFGYPRDDA